MSAEKVSRTLVRRIRWSALEKFGYVRQIGGNGADDIEFTDFRFLLERLRPGDKMHFSRTAPATLGSVSYVGLTVDEVDHFAGCVWFHENGTLLPTSPTKEWDVEVYQYAEQD